MRTPSDPASAAQAVTAFDPFGEPVTEVVARACPSNAGDRAARKIGGAVFWTLALAILAGRVYASDIPVVQTVAHYTTQWVALR